MTHRLAILALGMAIAPALGTPLDVRVPAAPVAPTEAQAKAAFLYNLPLFVEWPPNAFSDRGPLVIGLAAPTPVGEALRPVQGRLVREWVLAIRELREGDDPRGCHILFVPAMDERTSALLLSRLQGTPVLTVGEDERFTRRGGMVRVFINDARLRIDVNITRVEGAGLRISSKLLALAHIVRGGDGSAP